MKGQVFYIEMVGTFFFVSFILTVKYYNGSKDILINAIAISSVLYGMLYFTAPISSGCLNPAVGIA
jgi:glycerol uptake facilitator-like aquaporin